MKTNSFHNIIGEKLQEKKDTFCNEVKRKDVIRIIRFARVPSTIYNQLLKELVHLKIIKIVNKRKIENF